MSLSIALAVAAGGYVFGRIKVEQRPVLLLALEDSDRRLQDRIRKLLGPGEAIPPLLNYLTWIEPGTVGATIRGLVGDVAGGCETAGHSRHARQGAAAVGVRGASATPVITRSPGR